MRPSLIPRHRRALLALTAVSTLCAFLYISDPRYIPFSTLSGFSSTPCLDAIQHQRKVLLDTYRQSLEGVSHIAIVDYPAHHNAGDAAIWLGEVALMEALGKEIRYICATNDCVTDAMVAALSDIPKERTAILFHGSKLTPSGGGNFGDLWASHQPLRNRLVLENLDRKIRAFPQTFEFDVNPPSALLKQTIETYAKHPDLDIVGRDTESFDAMKLHFPTSQVRLTPDVALFIGHNQDSPVTPPIMRRPGSDMTLLGLQGDTLASFPASPRYIPSSLNPFRWPRYSFKDHPEHDVLILARYDGEGGQNNQDPAQWIPALQPHSAVIKDWGDEWRGIKSPPRASWGKVDSGNGQMVSFEAYWNQAALLRVQWAMDLLSRGKIVISDRLHTEIMSTLLGLGHVAVESGHLRKVERVMDTWLSGCVIPPKELEAIGRGGKRKTDANTVFVHEVKDAIYAAKMLLKGEDGGQRWSREGD